MICIPVCHSAVNRVLYHVQRVAGFPIIGCIIFPKYPCFFYPLFATATVNLACRLVINLTDYSNPGALDSLKDIILDNKKIYKTITKIALVSALILCILSITCGLISASVHGFLEGITHTLDLSESSS